MFNVDGTPNKQEAIQFYTILEVQTGDQRKRMAFFCTELGGQNLILGYPWFSAIQPRVDWAKGWLDYGHLPIVIRTSNARLATWTKRQINKPRPTKIARMAPAEKRQTLASKLAEEFSQPKLATLPEEYRRHTKVFSEKEAQRFPGPRPWDHAIDLKPDAPRGEQVRKSGCYTAKQ